MRRRAGEDDTICAISTAVGLAGIGVVRVSGEKAFQVVQPLYRGKGLLSEFTSHTAHFGHVVNPATQTLIDEALFLVMHGPRTYTTEDTVEIQTHGNPLILEKILSILLSQGARLASPGEFTRRAFLAGRLDLAQAEAVIEVITSQNWGHHAWALNQLRGDLSKKIIQLRECLLGIVAQIEASIDFSEEGITFSSAEQMFKEIQQVSSEVDKILSSYAEGRKIQDGFNLVIAGRPNVGKSSLMNLLLQEDRAIVTPVPGTTRDLLQERLQLDGLVLQLTDTAGYRETDDPIEAEGVRRGANAIKNADLVLWVIDASEPCRPEDDLLSSRLRGVQKLIVLNKVDLVRRFDFTAFEKDHPETQISLSTITKAGVETLKKEVIHLLSHQPEHERPIVALLRHKNALESAARALKRAEETAEKKASWEFLAADLREALDALGEIVGETTTDEILDQVFNQFCIGK
ncbi:MAG: tRNA uridine-5-carboxymethylaminomethyl(34) synthesis GTPase MnmE [Nitrospirae bacterium]|nr:tRNA uridine-5-carboxymethylaminomethyl(34) synthesis GTPase MnmE [Candidatus Manganitrophaceae bacterium]